MKRDIYNKNSFFKLSNIIFSDGLNYNKGNIHNSGCIELYIKLSINSNSLTGVYTGNITTLLNILRMKDYKNNIKSLKNRLELLQQKGLISIDKDISLLRKNDVFYITVNIDEEYGFTKLYEWDSRILNTLEAKDIAVYYMLRRYYNETAEKSWVTIDIINEKIGMAKRTILKSLAKLEYAELIEIKNNNYINRDNMGKIRKSNNTYMFKVPAENFEDLYLYYSEELIEPNSENKQEKELFNIKEIEETQDYDIIQKARMDLYINKTYAQMTKEEKRFCFDSKYGDLFKDKTARAF